MGHLSGSYPARKNGIILDDVVSSVWETEWEKELEDKGRREKEKVNIEQTSHLVQTNVLWEK